LLNDQTFVVILNKHLACKKEFLSIYKLLPCNSKRLLISCHALCLNVLDRKLKAAKGAFDTSLDLGLNFIDTAEVYGAGVTSKLSLSL
jgi:predicted aldo/keto reductase-like oxidoreductase